MRAFYLFVFVCILQLQYSQEADSPPDFSKIPLACINFNELITATAVACKQKENKALWHEIIKCHIPMTDEFMRQSAEARCPVKKRVEDPMDTSFSIEEVFFNICGLVEADTDADKLQGLTCLVNGSEDPFIMSHEQELREVESRFGKNVTCDVGTCIRGLGLGI